MITSVLSTFWTYHRSTIIRLLIALMATLALLKLGDEFRRLVWESGRSGANDLKLFHSVVHHWFSGYPVYGEVKGAMCPPASYVILWPLLGWLKITPARWLWATSSIAALWWLMYLVVHESGAEKPLERLFVMLLPLSMNATGVTIGNGQLIVHILPVLVAGFLLLHKGQNSWSEDLLAAVLIIVAMVKPTTSIPFFWIALFIPSRLRPAVLIILGYVVLSFIAASFQNTGPIPLLFDWVSPSSGAIIKRSAVGSVSGGYANIHTWLTSLGLSQWNLPASLFVLMAAGYWTYRHRHVDLWIQMGVIALVARFWVYHRVYDDTLFLLPMVALFRIFKSGRPTTADNIISGLLLITSVLVMLAPARLSRLTPPWDLLFKGGHAVVWIAVLIFLLVQSRHGKKLS